MKPLINFHYTIPFKEVNSFLFLQYGVDEVCYKERIIPNLPKVVETLKKFRESRQATITVNNNKNYACLLSLQFQIMDNKLIVIGNFRSQCRINGKPSDSIMLQYIATKVMKELDLKKYKIFVNVGNYHDNRQLSQDNKNNATVQANIKFLEVLY